MFIKVEKIQQQDNERFAQQVDIDNITHPSSASERSGIVRPHRSESTD